MPTFYLLWDTHFQLKWTRAFWGSAISRTWNNAQWHEVWTNSRTNRAENWYYTHTHTHTSLVCDYWNFHFSGMFIIAVEMSFENYPCYLYFVLLPNLKGTFCTFPMYFHVHHFHYIHAVVVLSAGSTGYAMYVYTFHEINEFG